MKRTFAFVAMTFVVLLTGAFYSIANAQHSHPSVPSSEDPQITSAVQSPSTTPSPEYSSSTSVSSVPFGYHGEHVEGALLLEDVKPPMQVCVHLPTGFEPQWNADIFQFSDGTLQITEHYQTIPAETNYLPAAGYGLVQQSDGLWANVWMTAGYC